MRESTYWLITVPHKFVKLVNGKKQNECDERIFTVWASDVNDAYSLGMAGWLERRPKTLINGTDKILTPRKLTKSEIQKMESVIPKK